MTKMTLHLFAPIALFMLGCSAEQRAAERTAIDVVEKACPLGGAAAVIWVPGADGKTAEAVCLGIDEIGDTLKHLLARRAVKRMAIANGDGGLDAAPALSPCTP